ncbi:MAG: DUF934 domain-containing protein, partial [Pseudomonadota bacterium]|nr:DUF934 domain-containing protein [Pseudomonadota bacterium]
MPLIKDGAQAEDTWTFIEEGDLPSSGRVTVPLAKLIEESDALLARNQQIGVRLSPADDPHDL